MSFNWEEYLHLAEELTGIANSIAGEEARLRSTISRAYYAAFIRARNYLRVHQDIDLPRNGDVHRYVREYFDRSSNELHRMIANDLARLRISRNRADSDDIMTQLPVLARMSLKLAARVLANLDALLLQQSEVKRLQT
ncbi:MAG: hypothetical protein HY785_26970 [Oscillatoriophycideae cyanobacterium NC_groundwater_1537_Pr4_S-0.65um_50_18]|nr:hypothetical protein [Oscillatoriophycideae cyanobacterium NC_groundwater_1537_Pr4_S-0.65um_50_18]